MLKDQTASVEAFQRCIQEGSAWLEAGTAVQSSSEAAGSQGNPFAEASTGALPTAMEGSSASPHPGTT